MIMDKVKDYTTTSGDDKPSSSGDTEFKDFEIDGKKVTLTYSNSPVRDPLEFLILKTEGDPADDASCVSDLDIPGKIIPANQDTFLNKTCPFFRPPKVYHDTMNDGETQRRGTHMQYYLAVDIGASSGRHILSHLEDGKMVLEEVHRFPNGMKDAGGTKVWDSAGLLRRSRRA